MSTKRKNVCVNASKVSREVVIKIHRDAAVVEPFLLKAYNFTSKNTLSKVFSFEFL